MAVLAALKVARHHLPVALVGQLQERLALPKLPGRLAQAPQRIPFGAALAQALRALTGQARQEAPELAPAEVRAAQAIADRAALAAQA